MSVYINSAATISAQDTFDTDELFTDFEPSQNGYFSLIQPEYRGYIHLKILRRMSKIVRVGVTCSQQAILQARIPDIDAIMVGTGLGCVEETLKFLNQINENDESLLNPTPFIQSTHNTVAGQIALAINCKNYNLTFSQQDVSFETALIDAFLMLHEPGDKNILVGAIDEITEKSFNLLQKAGCINTSSDNNALANNERCIPGEGAGFFVLSNKASNTNIARISAISLFNRMKEERKLPAELEEILLQRKISVNDIDVLISGLNGNISEDKNYSPVQEIFKESVHVRYKHLTGEFDTASGFAMWLGTKIIQRQTIPELVNINKLSRNKVENVLIHNYSKKHHHSFILLSKC